MSDFGIGKPQASDLTWRVLVAACECAVKVAKGEMDVGEAVEKVVDEVIRPD